MANILSEIVGRRRADVERLGHSHGFAVPESRTRPVTPFLASRGAILEVKRASPSKGDIAPDLDAAATARMYAEAGAAAISCLTETNYFRGTLGDLMDVCAAVDSFAAETGRTPPAVLRKDFLLDVEDVDVAFRAGADAVLLIARMLDAGRISDMARRCAELGISALVEVREDGDLDKLAAAVGAAGTRAVAAGVNSRDLRDFSMDALIPASMLSRIRGISGGLRVVFESGILSPRSASFAAEMGFGAILMGEAAARDPSGAAAFVSAFCSAEESANGRAWVSFAGGALAARSRPLVKVCGITRAEDAALAAELGADALGFVMWRGSARNVGAEAVRKIRRSLSSLLEDGRIPRIPLLVAVVVDVRGEECAEAAALVSGGTLDFLQVHTLASAREFVGDGALSGIPHYCAVNVGSEADVGAVAELFALGEPRVLVDAGSASGIGGTGERVGGGLVRAAAKSRRLWLAGGINAGNVAEVVREFRPELVDVSSGLESSPGVKDAGKMRSFFASLGSAL